MTEPANIHESTFSAPENSDLSSSIHTESASESLIDDLGEATHRVSADVHQVQETAADAFEVLRGAAVDCVSDIAAVVREMVRARPMGAIAAATAAGYVLSRLRGSRRR